MPRLRFGQLLMIGLSIPLGCCRPSVSATPTVTARGTTGEEDTPSLAIPSVTLKAGETLLVSSNDEARDACWNAVIATYAIAQ
jgi:hypothetical protein